MVANPWGFLRHPRTDAPKRPVPERLRDWDPVYGRPAAEDVRVQASRCMDCGVAFCHAGCPLGNLIPEWNELVARRRLAGRHRARCTPPTTSPSSPAGCARRRARPSCVLAINADPVTIKQVELAIIDRAYDEGWVDAAAGRRAHRPAGGGGRLRAGRAGLRPAADPGRAPRHRVRAVTTGSAACCATASPTSRWTKRADRPAARPAGPRASSCCTGVDVGGPGGRPATSCGPSSTPSCWPPARCAPRELDAPRPATWPASTRPWTTCRWPTGCRPATSPPRRSTPAGKRVVIIGGGDTAADCLGTANRQGAVEVHQLDHNPRPPDGPRRDRQPVAPVAQGPQALARPRGGCRSRPGRRRRSSSSATTPAGCGPCVTVEVADVRADGRRRFAPVDGSRRGDPVRPGAAGRRVRRHRAGLAARPARGRGRPGPRARCRSTARWETSAPGVFACGDATRGASLVVWAIAEARACAAAVDTALSGHTDLPAPVRPGATALSLRSAPGDHLCALGRRRSGVSARRVADAAERDRAGGVRFCQTGAIDCRRAVRRGGRAAGGGVLRPVDDRGEPVGPVEEVDSLAAAVAAREPDAPRWVWPATEDVDPELLAAGVVVSRCVDLALTEGILLGSGRPVGRGPLARGRLGPVGRPAGAGATRRRGPGPRPSRRSSRPSRRRCRAARPSWTPLLRCTRTSCGGSPAPRAPDRLGLLVAAESAVGAGRRGDEPGRAAVAGGRARRAADRACWARGRRAGCSRAG